MALVTDTPIFLDSTIFSRATPNVAGVKGTMGQDFGPWLVGANLYCVGVDDTSFGPHVYKSTDQGATWLAMDDGNKPSYDVEVAVSCFRDGVIYIAVSADRSGPNSDIPNEHKIRIVPFDTATDLYGTSGSYGPAIQDRTVLIAALSTGVIRAFYMTGLNVKFSDCTAGTWGSASLVFSSSSNSGVATLVLDADDRTHLVWAENEGGGHVDPIYIPVEADGTVGSWVDFADIDANIGVDTGLGVIYGGAVFFPVLDKDFGFVSVFRGTPLTGVSFAETVVYTSPGGSTIVNWPAIRLNAAGFPVLFWVVVDNSDGDPDQIMMSTFDGTSWGTPEVFYDAIANPPTDGLTGSDQFLHTIDAIQLSNGRWVLITAMETNDGTFDHCTGFVLVTPGLASGRKFIPQYIKRRNAP
jgi:hypothetical protein